MYLRHFAFTRFPFENTLQADELFASNARREAEARLKHLIELRGIGLMTGEVGCGKTTVCRHVTAGLHPGLYRVHYVSLSTGNVLDMYKSIAWELGLPTERSRATARRAIRDEITRLVQEAKQLPVLIIDEAQHLRNDVLEDLRLLTSFAMDADSRLCLLLVGLTELRRRLAMAVHESLNQRLVVRHHLTGLGRDELEHYLTHRLRLAGAAAPLFTPPAIEALFQASAACRAKSTGAITADALVLRCLLAEGKVIGPQFFTAGRILNNSNFRPPGFAPVHNETNVRDEIRWQALAGVDFIKIYSSMPPSLVGVAIDEAHNLGLPVIGHLQSTTWTEAARLGIDGLEHAAPWSAAYIKEDSRASMPEGIFARVYWLQHLDEVRINEMIASLVEHQIFVDPTLMATMFTKFWADDPRWTTQNPDLAYVPASLRAGWAAGGFTRDWTPAQFAEAKRSWPLLLGLIKKMYDGGVPLVAGTDTPTPWIVPGASLHDELKLLNESGVPPLEVIRIATSNAARALRRQHEFGSIAPGLRADLVLVSRNPLEDIVNTRAIDLVIQNGNVVFAAPSQARQ